MSRQPEECGAFDVALFALGALPLHDANAVEEHLQSGCEPCLDELEHFAAVADQLSLSVTPVSPSPELRQRVLDRIAPPAAREQRKIVRGNDSPWLALPIPGVETRQLIGNRTLLVRMQPGAVFPEHDHPLAEQCYVVAGSITDSAGLTLNAGDFIVMFKGTQHAPIHSETGCTLVIAYAD